MSAPRLPIAVAALTSIASPALARQDVAAYEGRDAIQEGVGGAKVSKHGIDYWTNGTPPRRFQLLGFITDKRRDSGLVPDIIGSKGVAKRSEEHTSELQSLMRISYDVFCLKKKRKKDKESEPDYNNTMHKRSTP